MAVFRLFRILAISLRFGLDELILGHSRFSALTSLLRLLLAWRHFKEPRALRLRLAGGKAGADFRQIRADAVHPPRPDSTRYCR